jgi:TldD protein
VKAALLDALSRSRAGYSELRLRRVWSSTVLVRDRAVETAASAMDTGGFARCCSSGTGWGAVEFSGTDRLATRLLKAHELSLAVASRVPVALAPIPIRELELAGTLADDPRDIPLADKRGRAESLSEALHGFERRVSSTRILWRDEVVETWLATSEGIWIHELRPTVQVAVLAVAEEAGNRERALGSVTSHSGWHAVDPLSLTRGVVETAVERLHARPIRPGRYSVVLDPAAAGALMHRAVAHLARPALPGADPDVLPVGTRVGPECLTVGDDPAAEGLPASASCDDEGTTTRRTVIIQNGVVLGHLHSRETAAAAGQAPTGHARAGSLRGAPYPRASNTYLAPGDGTLDDLLRPVQLGVYLSDVLTCEGADDQVTLRPARARMIRDGHLAEPVKGVQIGDELLALLGRVDAVAGDFEWNGAAARCRDGAAGVVTVSTGAPHLRLVDVLVGEGLE